MYASECGGLLLFLGIGVFKGPPRPNFFDFDLPDERRRMRNLFPDLFYLILCYFRFVSGPDTYDYP